MLELKLNGHKQVMCTLEGQRCKGTINHIKSWTIMSIIPSNFEYTLVGCLISHNGFDCK
jgi:hypothetical protein